MENEERIKAPQAEPLVSEQIKEKLLSAAHERGQVTIHCTFKAGFEECCIRIWKATYLVAHEINHQSVLLQSFNITTSPVWTSIGSNCTRVFTLIFSGLPKECKTFDMVESIEEPMPFHIRDIRRNENDVYRVDIY